MISFHRSQLGSGFLAVTLFMCGMLGTFYCRENLNTIHNRYQDESDRPPRYLPDAKYVHFVSLGYETTAAKVLWFATNNYFGKQFLGNHDYRWLSSMCEVTGTLDPKATHVFEFCATLLSWVANDPKEGIALLGKAISNNPKYWRFYYLRGFTYWYFLKDNELAKQDYLTAASIPGSPPELGSIAARFISSNDGPEISIRFLKELIGMTPDPNVKRKLGRKLQQAILARDLQYLQAAADKYEQDFGEFPSTLTTLKVQGYLSNVPHEPFNGEYKIDPETKKVITTSGRKPLVFNAKTSDSEDSIANPFDRPEAMKK